MLYEVNAVRHEKIVEYINAYNEEDAMNIFSDDHANDDVFFNVTYTVTNIEPA